MTQESVYCIKVSRFLKCKNSEGQRKEERRGCRGQREGTKAGENGEKKGRRKGVKEGLKPLETDMTVTVADL